MKTKVLFVCHGNICRSPMAEYVFKDMVKKRELNEEFYIASAATSREEIGNPVHHGTKTILNGLGISAEGKRAVQMTILDYHEYDYIIAMDQRNVINVNRIIGTDSKKKVQRLLDYTQKPRDIADPWYTGDFTQTYEDIYKAARRYFRQSVKVHRKDTLGFNP